MKIYYRRVSKIDNTVDYIELGRGLNEGLTEWITKKCGYYVEDGRDSDLTHFIEQLELAIGEEKVMSLGKGKDLEKLLNMSEEDVYTLLSKADRYYWYLDEIGELKSILNKYRKYRDIEELEDEEKEIAKEEFLEVCKSNEYKKYRNGKEYNKYLVDHNLLDTLDNFIKFCEVKLMKVVDSKQELATEIEDFIFSKYFSKEFEELLQKDKIPRDLMEKYIKLQELIHNEERKAKIKQLKERYTEGISREIEEKYNNNSLSIDDIRHYTQELSILKFKVIFTRDGVEGDRSESDALGRNIRKNYFWRKKLFYKSVIT